MFNTRSLWTVLCLVGIPASLTAADRPQWGEYGTRNQVSGEKGLPDWFDPGQIDPQTGDVMLSTTKNVKWVARLGRQTHGTPVVAEGRVLVGTNNETPRDSRNVEDRGVLMCFDEKTGAFLWQLVVPKLFEHKNSDWYYIGLCSSPVVENGRVYVVSNRCEVLCLDLAGMANGNDGPYRDEARHAAAAGEPPVEPGPKDADILWLYDMAAELGVRPHNSSNCSVLVAGDLLYVCTSNGVDWTHNQVANPAAPTLIVLNKKTGRLVAVDDLRLDGDIIHGQWCSPSMGRAGGRDLVFFGAGNGFVYGFEAVWQVSNLPGVVGDAAGYNPAPRKLKTVWQFNGHPLAQTQDRVPLEHLHATRSYEVVANPVFYRERVYVPITQETFHEQHLGWLVCLDAAQTGDITRTGLRWSYRMGASVSTPSIANGLVYVATDCGRRREGTEWTDTGGVADEDGRLHCLDAETGQCYWTQNLGPMVWGSTLVADGKVYVGTGGRPTLWVFQAGKEPKSLSRIRMRDRILTTPVAANGVLYVATWKHLYAIQGKEEWPDADRIQPAQ